MRYRSRTDICSQILDSANGGTTKTKIMYKAYLSYAQLKDYLSVLVENGLLVYDPASKKYKTSEKGLTFLQIYGRMNTVSGPLVRIQS